MLTGYWSIISSHGVALSMVAQLLITKIQSYTQLILLACFGNLKINIIPKDPQYSSNIKFYLLVVVLSLQPIPDLVASV